MSNNQSAQQLKYVQKFRKKPVVIEAVQWTGKNPRTIFDFIEGNPNVNMTASGKNFYIDHSKVEGGLVIKTLEGEHLASIYDWIIKGIKGEFYPCKADIFEKTYEPADIPLSSLSGVQGLETNTQLLRDAYEWWEYLISRSENDRLIKKYYPDEKSAGGYPRFFMDTDKLKIYCAEKGIELPSTPSDTKRLEERLKEAETKIEEQRAKKIKYRKQVAELEKQLASLQAKQPDADKIESDLVNEICKQFETIGIDTSNWEYEFGDGNFAAEFIKAGIQSHLEKLHTKD